MELYHGIRPEWTKENIAKKEGDTDLKKCGWCRYTAGGISQYGCILDASYCSLMGEEHGRCDWNDNCRFIKLSEDEKINIIADKLYEIGELSKEINKIRTQIFVIFDGIRKKG